MFYNILANSTPRGILPLQVNLHGSKIAAPAPTFGLGLPGPAHLIPGESVQVWPAQTPGQAVVLALCRGVHSGLAAEEWWPVGDVRRGQAEEQCPVISGHVHPAGSGGASALQGLRGLSCSAAPLEL